MVTIILTIPNKEYYCRWCRYRKNVKYKFVEKSTSRSHKKLRKSKKNEVILERYDTILYDVTLGNNLLTVKKKEKMHRYLEFIKNPRVMLQNI